jgi:hypothetical protein
MAGATRRRLITHCRHSPPLAERPPRSSAQRARGKGRRRAGINDQDAKSLRLWHAGGDLGVSLFSMRAAATRPAAFGPSSSLISACAALAFAQVSRA